MLTGNPEQPPSTFMDETQIIPIRDTRMPHSYIRERVSDTLSRQETEKDEQRRVS
jgi:hypothetical protein